MGRAAGHQRLLKAPKGRFQTAQRKARGSGRFATIRTVIVLIAGKLNFS